MDNLLDIVVASRKEFEANPSIQTGMTWAYNVSRLSVKLKNRDIDPDLRDSYLEELDKYIHGVRTTKISKQNGEYRVRLFNNGEYQEGCDYFTEDHDDAIGAAKRMEQP